MDRGELEGLDREGLVVRAQAAGIRRARILTRPELIDELLRLDPNVDDAQLRKSRGFFGRARDLVARVVERGLHLPDAADRIRTLAIGETPSYVPPRPEPQAMPTVTLAEIYAAQGHRARAVETLRRVIEREPDHAAAIALLLRLEDEGYVAPPPPLPPEPEVEPEPPADDDDDGAPDDDDGVEFVLVPSSDFPEPPPPIDAYAKTEVFDAVPERDVPSERDDFEEIEECIAIPLARDNGEGGGKMYVRWTVSPGTIGALLGARPHGRFVVRAHVVTPAWDDPTSELRDLIVDPDEGEATLVALPELSVTRVAVGWLDGATFVPIAHSPALEMSRGDRLAIWTLEGAVPVVLDDPRAASIARAVAASRRSSQANA